MAVYWNDSSDVDERPWFGPAVVDVLINYRVKKLKHFVNSPMMLVDPNKAQLNSNKEDLHTGANVILLITIKKESDTSYRMSQWSHITMEQALYICVRDGNGNAPRVARYVHGNHYDVNYVSKGSWKPMVTLYNNAATKKPDLPEPKLSEQVFLSAPQ